MQWEHALAYHQGIDDKVSGLLGKEICYTDNFTASNKDQINEQ